MSQRQLQLFHRIHQHGLELARRRVKDIPHGDPGKFFRQFGTNVFQDGKGTAVAEHGGGRSKPGASQIAQKGSESPQGDGSQLILPAADQNDDP